MTPGIRKTVATGFDAVLAQLPDALKTEGSGVLTEIDVRDTRSFRVEHRYHQGERTMDRGAIATWSSMGTSSGTLTTDSGALIDVPYSTTARFELEARPSATTPEELLAAAYAGCFTMTFAERLAAEGHFARSLRTEARVQLIKPSGYWEIPSIRLHCSADVPGIGEHDFLAIAHVARIHGPIARAMRATVTLTVSLESVPGREWRVPLH